MRIRRSSGDRDELQGIGPASLGVSSNCSTTSHRGGRGVSLEWDAAISLKDEAPSASHSSALQAKWQSISKTDNDGWFLKHTVRKPSARKTQHAILENNQLKMRNREANIETYLMHISSATNIRHVRSSQIFGAVLRFNLRIPKDLIAETKQGCRMIRMRRLVCISSRPNWSISMIRALCINCTVGIRCVRSFGEDKVDKFAIFRNMYSSPTSKIHGEKFVLSIGRLYAAPANEIASSSGFEILPGSNVGKWTIGKCQCRDWKKADMKAEILDTLSIAVNSMMSSGCWKLSGSLIIDFDVSASSVINWVSWLDSFDGNRTSDGYSKRR